MCAVAVWGCDRLPTGAETGPIGKPALNHSAPGPYAVVVDVNNYHLTLTDGDQYYSGAKPLQAGSYGGSSVLYGGGLAYGNGPAAVYYYHPPCLGASFKAPFPSDLGTVVDEFAPGPHADHQTLTVMLESVDGQYQSRAPIALVTVRETFAYTAAPDDDYVILKYTLNNFTAEDVTGLHLGQVLDIDAGAVSGDDYVRYDATNQLVIVTSGTPDVASGQLMLEGGVSTYRRWRIGQDPWLLAHWYARLSAGMGDAAAWGPFDVRHAVTAGPVTIPAGGAAVIAFALVAGDDEADLYANAAAARAKWTSLAAEARGAYTTPLADVTIVPRVLNLAAPGMFNALFEFRSAAEASQAVTAICSGARPFRAGDIRGAEVRAFFHTGDLFARLRPGEPIVCEGRLADGTRFLGADHPTLLRQVMPVTRLTFDPANDVDPSWSPDGQAIVFASDRGRDPEDYAIWRMDVAAGEASAVQVTTAGGRQPDWSPDGSTVVFSGGNLFTVPAGGGPLIQLTDPPNGPSWKPRYSPDGTKIVFERQPPPSTEGEIWTMTAEGELAGPPAVRIAFEGEWQGDPAWSPDGDLVYFVSVDPRPGGFGIYAIDPSIGEPATAITGREEGWGHYAEPAASPDGRHLAFLAASFPDVIVQDLRTGTHNAVLTDPPMAAYPFVNLEYSPDGKRLLFVSGHDIYLVEVSKP
jgi:Tol biopolymer transport system component